MARADAIEELVTEVLRTKEDNEKRVSGLANDVRELKETVTKMASDAEVNVKKDDEERVSGLANDVRELKEEVRNMARADAIEELVTEVLRTKEDDEKRVSSLYDDVRELKEMMKRMVKVEDVKSLVTEALSAKEANIEREMVDSDEMEVKTFSLQDDSDDDVPSGIINYLTKEYGGNLHEKGVVTVTASSVWDEMHPWSVLSFHSSSTFETHSKENSWICYDFKDRRVCPTGYMILGCRHCIIHEWKIQGSNDDAPTPSSWEDLDQGLNSDESVCISRTITCASTTKFRYIRLVQIGEPVCAHGLSQGRKCYQLALEAFEVFGTIFSPREPHPCLSK